MAQSELDKTDAETHTHIRAVLEEAVEAADLPPAARYTEGNLLGEGGMGKVVLARDARIGRDVAVKVLHPERELDEAERARFLREAQVQGQLEHPSIVPVYDIDRRPDGTTFFTMRRVLGVTLHEILEDLRAGVLVAKVRFTQRELLTAFATVCLTIDYAHTRGVVHRDLKPANIMLGNFGEVYVLDWGLARLLDEPRQRLSVPGEWLGTPLYMAPEQMTDPDVTSSADVYALGLILFELLTLERARDGNALYAPVEARPSIRAPYRNIAPELETICVRATALDPADRFPTARALQEAIARYLEGDRELEQRRHLAAGHAHVAREALDASTTAADPERDRTRAIGELVRALALEPQNDVHVAMLGEILASPPRALPPEVHAQVRAEEADIIRKGARYSTLAMAGWFAMLPFVMWAGIRDVRWVAPIAAFAGISLVASLVAANQRVIGKPIIYIVIASMMAASFGVTRMYGPVILVPTLVGIYAIVMQAHPQPTFRIFALACATIVMIVPVLLELAHVLPATYSFDGERWTILPTIVELPRAPTLLFLTFANIAAAIMPALFIARLRAELAAAQQYQLVQAWHFRRLGSDLMHARSPG